MEACDDVLEVRHIRKQFGSVVALEDVSLKIKRREIVAVLGENGAGKSTLCKILTGIYHQDAGDVFFMGEPAAFRSSAESIEAGIAMVYQERNLVPLLNGAQNICLGAEPKKGPFIDERAAMEAAESIQKSLHQTVPLDVSVDKLGAGEQQMLEIMRAIFRKPKLLILDEPTASLGEGEIQPFLNFVRNMTRELDVSVIFISHKLEDVKQIADRIIVLTDGRKKLDKTACEVTMEECIAAMLRSAEMSPIVVPEKDVSENELLLESQTGFYDSMEHSIHIRVFRGEVVGCYGLVGSGRTEWAEYLYGMRRAEMRSFAFCGETITKCSPRDMIERGMVLIPEKRGNGIFRDFTIRDNIGLMHMNSILSNRFGFVRRKKMSRFAEDVVSKYNVRCADILQPIKELSGGNIQKVIIGRSCEAENCKLLIADEPTNGMDVGAKHDVHIQLRRLADEENMGVIFISSELIELLSVCDRIAVFYEGNIICEYARGEFDRAKILESAVSGRYVK